MFNKNGIASLTSDRSEGVYYLLNDREGLKWICQLTSTFFFPSLLASNLLAPVLQLLPEIWKRSTDLRRIDMQTDKKFSTKQKKAKSEARYKWISEKQAVNERYWSNCKRLSDLLSTLLFRTIHGITSCPMGRSYSILSLVRYWIVLMNLCGDTKQF